MMASLTLFSYCKLSNTSSKLSSDPVLPNFGCWPRPFLQGKIVGDTSPDAQAAALWSDSSRVEQSVLAGTPAPVTTESHTQPQMSARGGHFRSLQGFMIMTQTEWFYFVNLRVLSAEVLFPTVSIKGKNPKW